MEIITCGQDVVASRIDIHGLSQQTDNYLRPIVHCSVMQKRQTVFVLLCQPWHLLSQSFATHMDKYDDQSSNGRRSRSRHLSLLTNTKTVIINKILLEKDNGGNLAMKLIKEIPAFHIIFWFFLPKTD